MASTISISRCASYSSRTVFGSIVDKRERAAHAVDHTEHPLETAADLAEVPRRAAHDALVPQPDHRREVVEDAVEQSAVDLGGTDHRVVLLEPLDRGA